MHIFDVQFNVKLRRLIGHIELGGAMCRFSSPNSIDTTSADYVANVIHTEHGVNIYFRRIQKIS